MTDRVAPYTADPDGVLSLKDMDPDFNGDGIVSPLEKQVYDYMREADTNNDGYLTRREVFHVITRMKSQIDEASGSGIPIDALSPAQWGERKVAAWEEDVFKRIKEADEDKSGVISVKELFGVIKGAAKLDKEKKIYQKLLAVAVIVIFVLIGAMLGTAIVAGEAVKESHVDSAGTMTTLSGSPVALAALVETGSLFDLPMLSAQEMARVEGLDFYVDMSGGSQQMAVKPSSMYTGDSNMAVIISPEGHTMTIFRSERNATITMGAGPHVGMTFPIGDPVDDLARKLEESSNHRRQMRRGRGSSSGSSFSFGSFSSTQPNTAGNR